MVRLAYIVGLMVMVTACTGAREPPTPIGGEDRPGQTVGTPEGNQEVDSSNVGEQGAESVSIPATLGPAGEADLAREDTGTFSIQLSGGEIETTLSSDDGADYLSFYEEPSGSPVITDEPRSPGGMHTLSFVSPDESYTVLITFPDQLPPGTHGVGSEAADPTAAPIIAATVELADSGVSYNVLNSGTLNVDSLEDGLLSGSFEFQLASTLDEAQTVTMSGTFDNLLLDKDVLEEETQRTQ